MIPRIIHYCWFGHGTLPKLALKCLASWKRYLPDYEIREWNENNFDITSVPYVTEAYIAKKYAFVSDYVRFWALFHFGGVYFDTDVEVVKPLDDIIKQGPFMGRERTFVSADISLLNDVNPGLGFGSDPGNGILKELLIKYETTHFVTRSGDLNLKTVVDYTTEVLRSYGLSPNDEVQFIAGFYVYPKDYFCPKDYYNNGKITFTPNTRTIHHFAESWIPKNKYVRKITRLMPQNLREMIWWIKRKSKRFLSLK